MNILTPRGLVRFSALLAGLALSGCGVESSPDLGEGSAEMTMVALASADVTSVSVTVGSPLLAAPRVSSLFSRNGQWGVLVGGLPAGPGYSFTATASDATGIVLYTGGADNITVVRDQTVEIIITAQQASLPPVYRNAVPIFDSLVVSSAAVGLGQPVSVRAVAHDPDAADTVTYRWSGTCGVFSNASQAATTWTAPMAAGSCQLTIEAADPRGATATASITVSVGAGNGSGLAQVSVVANTWPVVEELSVGPNGWLDSEAASTLTVAASDADNDPLIYLWTSTCLGDFSAMGAASPTFSLAMGQTGVCTFTVAVADGRGGSTTADLSLPIGAPVVGP